MNFQEANYVEILMKDKPPLDKVAEMFYRRFGASEYCRGPVSKAAGIPVFDKLDGNDIKQNAEMVLKKRF